jgi:hypothetical protein
MNKRVTWIVALTFFAGMVVSSAQAQINRVRVVNDTDTTIYIHKGGYAPSVRLPAGKWRIFYYPFYVTPPNSKKKIPTSLLVATSGGRWLTTPNGFTYLHKPKMIVCLDYNSQEHRQKKGNRVWTIKRASGFSPGCKIKGYRQPWYQPQAKSKQTPSN